MLMANNNSDFLAFNDDSADGDDHGAADDFDGLSIDLDSFWDILAECPDRSNNSPDSSSSNNITVGLPGSEGASVLETELGRSTTISPSENSEASEFRNRCSDHTVGSSAIFDHAKLEPSMRVSSPVNSCSGSLADWMSSAPRNSSLVEDRGGVFQNASPYFQNGSKETQFEIEIPNCNAMFSVSAGGANNVLVDESKDFQQLPGESEFYFRHLGSDAPSEEMTRNQVLEKSDFRYEKLCGLTENKSEILGAPQSKDTSFMDLDMSLRTLCHSQSSFGAIPDIVSGSVNQYSAMPEWMAMGDSFYSNLPGQYIPQSFDLNSASESDVFVVSVKDEGAEIQLKNHQLNSMMTPEAQVERAGGAAIEVSRNGDNDVRGYYANCEGVDHILPMTRDSSGKTNGSLPFVKAERRSLHNTLPTMSSKKQVGSVIDKRGDELDEFQGSLSQPFEVVDDIFKGYGLPTNQCSSQPLSMTSNQSRNHRFHAKDDKEDLYSASEGSCCSVNIASKFVYSNPNPATDNHSLVSQSKHSFVQPSTLVRNQLGFIKEERESKRIQKISMRSHSSTVSHQMQSNVVVHRPTADADICIIDDTVEDGCVNPPPVKGKSFSTPQPSAIVNPPSHTGVGPPSQMGVGGARVRPNDERFVFRVALQDLSQPKSEATPPDGVLAVPLLRHQRIALSWMIQKETTSLHCSGGILADDQGLGKTVSTIALMLRERSPSSKLHTTDVTKKEMEMLNLDEDDGVSEVVEKKINAESCQVNGSSINVAANSSLQAKGRPAAGTLVVCPTSVLRQWADELHNKVTSEANLSVLIYHGSSRTKDPYELAKYDVVLTTYSIVSMEVPKQPIVNEDYDETGKRNHVPDMGYSSSKKRKYPPSSGKRPSKSKKAIDSEFLESIARPLARVGWFRVVLDEAQSIKNHRTQVARACWGLRAKRRWCLSGTPIQNAVDDLYSYFRFLRYDPYAVYKSFCSTIKVPIQRNPTNGYKKLQAVLKTVMLRRTKGTLLDGEPIITLPPKYIELKKVDFTKKERDFYCRLEADSRAQFAEYAAAGTVKQNYVNILLMLLRLRQACDHPLLVRDYNSNSAWRSSVQMAKKIPREKQVFLLNCLEASQAICGLCNDPPEDAAVTSCGHVFCNQCISEHLNGDDNHCPTANCKSQVSLSAIYSSLALKSALSDQPSQGSPPNSCTGEPPESLEPCSFDSSKIKAALEVLQSLSEPRDCVLRTSSSNPVDEASTSENWLDTNLNGNGDTRNERKLDVGSGSDDIVKAVREKAIVFSQWTRMLDLLEACLKDSAIQYRRLDGTMSVVARDKAVKDFNTNPEVTVMIMSLKAASLGLNMVAACNVILLDLWWNPTTEDQAIDRAHRIGQTRPVKVLRLTVKDTVEDRILALQQKKRKMVASAFGEDETGSRQTRLTVEDLEYLFMV